ncbi:hypothetical protein DAPPUDRAFT_247440 [Daphnia pulex]|uniref:Uncharacterized protein n=1 Tax=Daphnia pulex TaxID=6669 RepID=E9GSE8_DAPPU|nr:hypothetical protein DAPPUDRAFT_247440 [Daphnia pulex]|eukprot:EFX77589.1 hypothetical protein DAPPUDRAFT_247440 [Daphnia pulex]
MRGSSSSSSEQAIANSCQGVSMVFLSSSEHMHYTTKVSEYVTLLTLSQGGGFEWQNKG